VNQKWIPYVGNRSDLPTCDRTTELFQVTLIGVVPESLLELQISSVYEPGSPIDVKANCSEKRLCYTKTSFNTPGMNMLVAEQII